MEQKIIKKSEAVLIDKEQPLNYSLILFRYSAISFSGAFSVLYKNTSIMAVSVIAAIS